MDAFDSDVLMYAADRENPMGRRVDALFPVSAVEDGDEVVGIGSVLLLPEVLAKPLRDGNMEMLELLEELLGRLELRPTTMETARLAARLRATYGMPAADAIHLATAVETGADRFITNNSRDFPQTIEEIQIIYPQDLDDPPEM
jgi:predicted nucleic acid-binding protein